MAAAAAAAAATLSQLPCFSSVKSTNLHLHRRGSIQLPSPSGRQLSVVVMSVADGESSGPEMKNASVSFTPPEDSNHPFAAGPMGRCPVARESWMEEKEIEESDDQSNKVYGSAKIHDFCFGIPYGGLVLSEGLLGFLFSRNLGTLGSGVLCGGALLWLGTSSLKIWRQGKSSMPFVLGQAVLAATLSWKYYEAYSLTKELIPTGFYTFISVAMACFYVYVMISGGNPPPKKLHSSAMASS